LSLAVPTAVRETPPRRLPDWPQGWYVIGRSAALQPGHVSAGRLADREFVIFRGEDGRIGAIDAHCPHMGAHLGGGRVVDNRLVCPLHRFSLDRSGHCRDPEGRPEAASRCWPVAESLGLILVFPGRGTPPPPPTEAAPDDYAWITTRPVSMETDWQAMMVNSFDLLHMRSVHRRELIGEPEIRRTSSGGVRLRYESRVVPGGQLSDRAMRWLSGDRIRVQLTCHGPTMLVESDVGRNRYVAFFGLLKESRVTRAYGAFGVPRGMTASWLRLRVARWLFTAFLRRDFDVVRGMRMTLDGVGDPGVKAMAAYLASLPEFTDA
jgi:phenylpropionate dioxygenase-like ring-hydroxylating dioxygenase large terminal subunit